MGKRVVQYEHPYYDLFEIKLRRHPDYRIFVVNYVRLHVAAVFIQHRSRRDELVLQRCTTDEGQCRLSTLMYHRPRYYKYSPRKMNKQLNFRVHMLTRDQDEAVAMLKRRRAYLGLCG